MADLISRAAAIEICKSIVPNTNPDFYNLRLKAGYGSWMHSNGEVCATTNIEVEIEKLPAVDAVPIVRCKDCKYSDVIYDTTLDTMPLKCLNIRYGGVMPDWYCEHVERRG